MFRTMGRIFLGEYEYSTKHRLLEFFGTIGFFLLCFALSYRVYFALAGMELGVHLYWIIPAIVLVGYTWADFVSGFFHWMGDTFGSEETPVLGPSFVKPFRDHHTDPRGITRHDFLEVNGNNCILIMIFVGPFYFLPIEEYLWAAVFGGLNAVFALSIFMTNQFHKWSHLEERPGWMKLLHRSGLVLSPEHHDVHHAPPYDKYYCITSGWCNPVLRKTRFFVHLERIVRKVLRIPKPGTVEP